MHCSIRAAPQCCTITLVKFKGYQSHVHVQHQLGIQRSVIVWKSAQDLLFEPGQKLVLIRKVRGWFMLFFGGFTTQLIKNEPPACLQSWESFDWETKNLLWPNPIPLNWFHRTQIIETILNNLFPQWARQTPLRTIWPPPRDFVWKPLVMSLVDSTLTPSRLLACTDLPSQSKFCNKGCLYLSKICSRRGGLSHFAYSHFAY